MKYALTIRSLLTLFGIFCASSAAGAQENTQAQQLKKGLAECATIGDSLKRLVCYDNFAAAPIKKAGDVAAQVPSVPVPPAPVAEFGREHLGQQNVDEPEQESRITIEIVSHRKHPHGYLIINTADGQTWRQASSEYFPLSDSATYFIERGLMGAYYLGRTDLNSRTRIKRTN